MPLDNAPAISEKSSMARKTTLNLTVTEPLLAEFHEACRAYGHSKQKGQVLSAALMMFLAADPRDQGHWVEAVMRADVDRSVEALLERVRREQGLRVATLDAQLAVKSTPIPSKKAAKKRPPARKAVRASSVKAPTGRRNRG